jgi:hypothetical protein
MRMMDTPGMSDFSVPRGIEFSSMSYDIRYTDGDEEYCILEDNPNWDSCKQANTMHTYSSYLVPELIPERDAPTLELPFRTTSTYKNPSYLIGGYDQDTGYTMQQNDYTIRQLETSQFLPNKAEPIVCRLHSYA